MLEDLANLQQKSKPKTATRLFEILSLYGNESFVTHKQSGEVWLLVRPCGLKVSRVSNIIEIIPDISDAPIFLTENHTKLYVQKDYKNRMNKAG